MARTVSNRFLSGMSDADAISNIAAVLDLATAQDYADGISWYRRARRTAGVIGRLLGYKGAKAYRQGAGIIAALSPSCEWDRNVSVAFAVVRNGGEWRADDDSKYQSRANIDKARAIMLGARPLDVLGGDKVRNFYACIIEPSNSYAVCIDRHAAAVAYGRTLSEREMSNAVAVLATVSRYEAIADAYRAVAAARGLLPMDVQAITWVTWRRLKDGARTFTIDDALVVSA